jgi:hypothetical protein
LADCITIMSAFEFSVHTGCAAAPFFMHAQEFGLILS